MVELVGYRNICVRPILCTSTFHHICDGRDGTHFVHAGTVHTEVSFDTATHPETESRQKAANVMHHMFPLSRRSQNTKLYTEYTTWRQTINKNKMQTKQIFCFDHSDLGLIFDVIFSNVNEINFTKW